MLSGPRHLVVVATQTLGMEHLVGLEEVAADFASLLLDPVLGGFEPGLPDGRCLVGASLGATAIEALIGRAIVYAGQRGAVLALALIGHGAVAGDDPNLYYLGSDPGDNLRTQWLDVGALLVDALDHPGIAGVMAVIDTCHAHGGVPDTSRMSLGDRGGTTALAVLSGATARQDAYDLALTRELCRVLRSGIPGEHDRLKIWDLHVALKGRVPGSDVGQMIHADHAAMWLAMNRAWSAIGSSSALAVSDLTAAVNRWSPGRPVPDLSDRAALDALRAEAAAAPDRPERLRVLEVLRCLEVAARTAAFLDTWDDGRVTSRNLQRALRLLRGRSVPVEGPKAVSVVSMLEYVALTYLPPPGGDCVADLVRFVMILMRTSGEPFGPELFRDWKRSIGAELLVADELERSAQVDLEHRARLVLVIRPAGSEGFPREIDAWVLDRKTSLGRRTFPCEPDRSGCEASIQDAVGWARDAVSGLDLPLVRIDIAAPAALLFRWRPEQTIVFWERLGVAFDVRVHWSDRLKAAYAGVAGRLRQRMQHLADEHGAPRVTWMSRQQVVDREVHRLVGLGRLTGALGLNWCPSEDILEHLPPLLGVVIWPCSGEVDPRQQAAIEEAWPRLPAALIEAYRESWRHDDPALVPSMADLRAVWDDPDWLDFSDYFQRGRAAT